MEALLDRAEAALVSGRPELCLALLGPPQAAAAAAAAVSLGALGAGAPAGAHDPFIRRRLCQLQALCGIQVAAGNESWWKLLGLEERSASAEQVRSRFRRLAAAVHPDKCSLPGADLAFQKLQLEVLHLLEGLQEVEEGPRAAKRRRGPKEEGAFSDATGAGLDDVELDCADDAAWLASDNSGFPWWSEWDPPAQQQQQQQQAPPLQQERGQPPAGPQRTGVAAPVCSGAAPEGEQGAGRAPRGSSSDGKGVADRPPSAAISQDEREMQGMGLEELRAEVRRRQDALLVGGRGSSGGREQLPVQELQARLRRAKGVLISRLEQEKAAPPPLEGGFIREFG